MQQTPGFLCTMAKVGKSDCERTFTRAPGNDKVAPFAAVAQTAGNQAGLHEADFQVRWCGDREQAAAPAARACGAINDPGMIERRARLNEVANEPDAR